MTETAPINLIPATKWWHAEKEGDRIVCDLCPRECRLGEEQRGFCFVRKNEGGEMVLTTYGKSTGFCIDPIEKKPLNHFLPGTPVLSFGTAGCNLGCKFCQNWDISKSREIEILSQNASPEAIVRAAKKSGCRSIAFTYNDPVIWAEYAIETAKIARAEGIKTVAVTAGYITPEARPEFFEFIDAANVDLKAFTDVFYRQLAYARLDPVLDTLKWLKHESNTWFEITTLIIPGQNDSPEEIGRMCDWVLDNLGDDVPLHFTAFHPDFKMRDIPATPHQTLIEARAIALDRGIKYAYVGNVLDGDRQNTYCPSCREIVIERNHYELGRYQIRDGGCANCGEKIPGVFENEAGNWGRKRLPLSIRDTTTTQNHAMEASNHEEPTFNATTQEALLGYARHLVESAILNRPILPTLPPRIAEIPCQGLFVSLKRGHLLRGCIGNYRSDETHPISALLERAAPSVATQDRRFPSIVPEEFPYLSLEITPMHAFRELAETGEDRVGAIEIGKHGLILGRGEKRGLLLPQVAVEQGYDARTFLEQVSQKAGFPKDAWLREDTTLTVFEGTPFSSLPTSQEIDPTSFPRPILEALAPLTNALLSGKPGEMQVPTILNQPCNHPLGVILEVGDHRTFALHAGGSLVDQIRDACRSLLAEGRVPDTVPRRLHLLSTPITLRAQDYPHRHGQVVRCAVLARLGERFAITLPRASDDGSPVDPISEALKSIGLSPSQWANSGAEVIAFQRQTIAFPGTPSTPSPASRPAAMAGKFYPATAAEIKTELDDFFAEPTAASAEAESCRAVMLPHAGWKFCGDIIAETLARVIVPEIVVVIGPKHTPNGANWSVSASESWQLPHATIPVATKWATFLADHCPGLQRENAAHQAEHGCEVLLPFLHRRNPKLQIVPIAIGAADYDDLTPLAEALAALRVELGEKLLLVISSDMNHFADDIENRRRDALALEKFQANDPRGLFDVCRENDISMCGLRPAVAVMLALKKESPPVIEVTRYETSARITSDTHRVVGYAGALLR